MNVMNRFMILILLTLTATACSNIESKGEDYEKPFSIDDFEVPPDTFESTLWDNYEKYYECKKIKPTVFNGKNISKNKKYIEILNSISNRLVNTLGCDIEVPLYLITDNEYKAYTTPSGIFITEITILDSESMDEIAWIIAHEITHYIYNDSFEHKKLENQVRLSEDQISRIENKRILYGHSQQIEARADYFAIDIMVKADFSPQGAFHAIERIGDCLENHESDMDKKIHEAADSMNKNVKDGSFSGYFDGLEQITTVFGQHAPTLIREKIMSTYVAKYYRTERRRDLTEITFM